MSSENALPTGQLSWRVFQLTEKAIALIDSGRVDDAVAVVENRERLLNLLATRADITTDDTEILQDAEKLNSTLLAKFTEARDEMRKELQRTQRGAEAHRAYHSGQVK